MSHTDKTRPFWVRVAEHPGRTAQPHHDHRHGDCDLPAHPAPRPDHSTRCTWAPTDVVLYGRDHGCGCDLCTGQSVRRAGNRAYRRQVRALLAAATRTADADVDVPRPRPSLW